MLCACDGTWVAHGWRRRRYLKTVDSHDRLRVPPQDPQYTLRRVWLTKEEEEGYYYGFANEGLWPLCHIAHTRPLFRASRLEALSGSQTESSRRPCWKRCKASSKPVVLVQDYHFALLPRMIKRAQARCASGHFLAYSVAEPGGVRDLPVAARVD